MNWLVSRRTFTRLRDSSSGQALIEAALVSLLMFLVSFAVAEYGAMIYVRAALKNGVSQATRYGITGQVVPGSSRQESIMEAMRDATPTLTIDDVAFDFANIPEGGSSWVGGTGGPNAIERVTVTYEWPIMTPLMRPFFDDDYVTFVVQSVMKNEGVIQF